MDSRLGSWADRGLDDGHLEELGKAAFGRLVTLAHPDTDDPDALLIAAQLNASWWAADDYYADDTALGAVPALPARLALAMAAMDPVPPAGDLTPPLRDALGPTGPGALARRWRTSPGTPPRPRSADRLSTFAMYVTWTAYAAWREAGEYPPAWEYLAARQHDSFYTSMTLIDVVGGYEVPANLYADPRSAAPSQAGTARVIVNDLHSVGRDAADENPECNLVLLLAADRGCSVAEATEVAVTLHNDIVAASRPAGRARGGALAGATAVRARARAWMGGCLEWHDSSSRYK